MKKSEKLELADRKAILFDFRSAKIVAEALGVSEIYVNRLRADSNSTFFKNFRKSLTEDEYNLFEWSTRIRKFCKRYSKLNKHLSEGEILLIALKEYPRPE